MIRAWIIIRRPTICCAAKACGRSWRSHSNRAARCSARSMSAIAQSDISRLPRSTCSAGWRAWCPRRSPARTIWTRPARVASQWWVAPIESSNELFGYMAASIPDVPAGDQLSELVLERMIDVAAVELAREGAKQRHLHGDFVYELLSERRPDFAVLE